MSSRPLENLPTIRAKLGSTIIFAVGMTVLLIFLMLGYALRGSAHDSDRLRLLAMAGDGVRIDRVPSSNVTVIRVNQDVAVGEVPVPPRIRREPPRVRGSDGAYRVHPELGYAAVPVVQAVASSSSSTPSSRRRPRGCSEGRRDVPVPVRVLVAVPGRRPSRCGYRARRGSMARARDDAAAPRHGGGGPAYGDRRLRGPRSDESRDEVGQLATAFNRMSAELQNLEQSRRDLVANVSHELKTPIAAIRAHLENLLDGVEQPDPTRCR